jgi:hypothetical protein
MARGDVQADWYIALGSGTVDIQPGSGDEYVLLVVLSEEVGTSAMLSGRAGGSTTGLFITGGYGASGEDSRMGVGGQGVHPIQVFMTNGNFMQIVGDTAGIDVGYGAMETK